MAEASTVPTSIQLGYLTILNEGAGQLGGLLITNCWGRPIEFRLSTAVQPNRLQQILYGPTLQEYISADLIGKTLIDKSSTSIHLLVVDSPSLLTIRTRLEYPVVAIPFADEALGDEFAVLKHARCSKSLILSSKHSADSERLLAILDRIDVGLDLCEPFNRIREAISEARRMGVQNRVAA
ncbi:hypothetical protein KIH39_01075 [Telmatocola sphagniphila]|uniref:Uncharacterized protein n=1 Tax=Telmatocola sphagniphila TaxID=1123043 RepID=A0A8E6B8V9_9BACT|nr:hypothetical protein [Telmatocola sphagniphila]QVL32540.1 hypothetical protein KIH39_01075 [Telmatocola sphagniphila]